MSKRFGRQQKRKMNEKVKTLQAELVIALADKIDEINRGKIHREACDQTARVLGRYFATLPPQDMAINYPMDRLRIPSMQKMEACNPNFTAEYLGEALHAIEAGILTGKAYKELSGVIKIQCTYNGKPYGIAISDEAVARLDERELSRNITTALSVFIASELKRVK